MTSIKTRRNVWDLQSEGAPLHDSLLWYGKAVAEMKLRPISDPTSWRYQAAIHEYNRAKDPLQNKTDKLPSSAEQDTYWAQCQHGSWFFLPWHRMYLHHFESIVAAEIVRLGGPSGWALSYWNYSESPDRAKLPPAFRRPTLTDGSPNPLFVKERDARANAGASFASPRQTDIKACLKEQRFTSASTGSTPGFGGPETKFEHDGDIIGLLEGTPHGSMHVSVAGPDGWMAAFHTAALDPIFWLHHANIDRLWEVWRKRSNKNTLPTDGSWLNTVMFPFRAHDGSSVTMSVTDVLDTTVSPLSYAYDKTSDPLGPADGFIALTLARTQGMTQPPEMIGATASSVPLGGAPREALLDLLPTAGAQAVGGGAVSRRLYLNIENVTATQRVPGYDVYINLPDGAAPALHQALCVGHMAMFGVVERTKTTARHAGSGLNYVFEITEQFHTLAQQGSLDPAKLKVTFVPTQSHTRNATIGRVSLYTE